MENLTLKVEGSTGEFIFREGEALRQVAPKKIVINGDIKTVSSYLKKRAGLGKERNPGLQGILTERTLVTVDKAALSIKLELDPENEYGTEVTAKLEMDPELLKFKIETGEKFTQQQLIKLLKYGKRWFHDLAAHEALLLAYMKLDVKVTADLKNDAPDGRGNRYNSFEKKVTSNIPEDFILNMPIFKGQDSKIFRVEIGLDSTDGSTKFWLESVELVELIQLESERILKAELESCKDYVVIWK